MVIAWIHDGMWRFIIVVAAVAMHRAGDKYAFIYIHVVRPYVKVMAGGLHFVTTARNVHHQFCFICTAFISI